MSIDKHKKVRKKFLIKYIQDPVRTLALDGFMTKRKAGALGFGMEVVMVMRIIFLI